MEIIEKYGSVIGNGYGGIDGASLNSVFDWCRTPAADRGYLAQKIIGFFKALSNKETKRVPDENNRDHLNGNR